MKKALLQLHTAVFLWGFTGVLGRAITLTSTMLVWWRLLITAVSLWVLYAALRKSVKVDWRSAVRISLIGTLLALHWVCFYGSIKLANVTIALTCFSTTGFFAAVVEPVLLRRRFDPVELLLGLCAIGGIGLIYYSHLQFSVGIWVGLAASLFTVGVSVLNKTLVDKHSPETITLYQLTGGLAGLTVLLPLFQFLFPEPFTLPSPTDWLWLVVLGWFCTVLTFFLYIRALKKVSAFTLNLTLTLEPIYGIVLAFLLYNEDKEMGRLFYAGFALIAAAVLFHMWRLVRGTKPAVEVN